MMRKAALVVLVLVLLFLWMRHSSGYNQTLIFGSPSCGWCKKQLQYMDAKGLPYHFVDCNTNACPGASARRDVMVT
jgi:hypothetical protein